MWETKTKKFIYMYFLKFRINPCVNYTGNILNYDYKN